MLPRPSVIGGVFFIRRAGSPRPDRRDAHMPGAAGVLTAEANSFDYSPPSTSPAELPPWRATSPTPRPRSQVTMSICAYLRWIMSLVLVDPELRAHTFNRRFVSVCYCFALFMWYYDGRTRGMISSNISGQVVG
jgi:hypothetical protein